MSIENRLPSIPFDGTDFASGRASGTSSEDLGSDRLLARVRRPPSILEGIAHMFDFAGVLADEPVPMPTEPSSRDALAQAWSTLGRQLRSVMSEQRASRRR